MTVEPVQLCIVGGGPAGIMAGYLFARAGVRTLVLEKHDDFLRDFRGDTVHPSTLDLFGELGLLERLLARPHAKVETVSAVLGGRTYRIANFNRLPPPGRFIAMMPQWEFLDFLAGEAAALTAFTLQMGSAATELVRRDGRVAGVRTATGDTIRADYLIAADGRGSLLRQAADLPLQDLGAPIDVFWFRVPKQLTAENRTQGFIDHGHMVVVIDRGDYYQCARVIGKGEADAVRAAGIERFRSDVVATAPVLADAMDTVTSFDDVKLLSVSLDRLRRWHTPGLLAIGDAAHAMSPVGGVGINLAIQDAVAAANFLAAPLAAGLPVDALAAKVQQRRMLPTRFIQGLQHAVHERVIGAAFRNQTPRAGALLRLVSRVPALQSIPARILGLGFRREYIRSPVA
ncbi:FAD-dependent oxidoreductase [Sphingomonas sp. SUN019]|uniref:FAD-dependent oxidoreductase n=1 Tax=Sphingomonas sp. SUN019 TaxID=2937788 RepID=UPI002164C8A2|nr:FAD-dependent oxidoreductase [Sphingomonas sp. SUN019]UVO50209.1 FAD-dependent oxidoreductase [Sphingomonas sp. SUN019]